MLQAKGRKVRTLCAVHRNKLTPLELKVLPRSDWRLARLREARRRGWLGMAASARGSQGLS